MIKAVLFDMDGVLYDSMSNHVQAWSETASAWGLKSEPEDFYLMEGRTGPATIDVLFNRNRGRDATPEEKEIIYNQKSRRFVELNAVAQPMPGAMEVLEKVKQLGLLRIVVTGSGQYTLFENLDTHFPGFFDKDLIVTAYDVRYGKPHPEPYLMGLKKANLAPQEAVVIENAPLGIESAVAAEIYTIAVNTGPLPDEILLKAGAHSLFPSMKALAESDIWNQLSESE
ncbi:MAG: HAD-IA family hydrolase [Candidatus Azobacteroides sp.]|nr:HAD-IA family hydrolase [Candidatus Azobacteroides sp.]